MATVDYSTLRQRFSSTISTLTGFEESRNPYDGQGRSPNTIAHQMYSVGIRASSAQDADRQRKSDGVMVSTEVTVRYYYRIKPKDQLDSYDDGMDSANLVIKTLTNRSAPLHTDTQVRFSSMANELTDSGEWLTVILTFTVTHQINIS